jgi:polysaccharide biosynthesis protein PelE
MSPLRLLWLVALPLEAFSGWLILSESSGIAVALGGLAHVLASLVFGLSLLTRIAGRWHVAWALLGGVIALVAFPIIGMVAMLIGYIVGQVSRHRVPLGAGHLFTSTNLDEGATDAIGRAREVEIELLDELDIEPVVDVLRENDPELKRAAIEVITKQGGPGAVRLLIGLLHDPSPDARFFSSIALSRLEDEISRTILAAQREVAEQPDSSDAQEQLGQLYLDYALSGFLEGVTREYYLDLAREAFENAAEHSADPDAVLRRLARVMLLQGSVGEAAAIIDELARRRPEDDDLRMLRMDSIYRFGDFRELVTYARREEPALTPGSESRELAVWWATSGTPEAAIAE